MEEKLPNFGLVSINNVLVPRNNASKSTALTVYQLLSSELSINGCSVVFAEADSGFSKTRGWEEAQVGWRWA